MTMLLIRHAATDMAGTLCGQSDPPLNQQGRQQAEALAASLGHVRLDRLYTSNLKRAIETAATLARPDIPLIVSEGLGEIHYGEWEGCRWVDVCGTVSGITTYEESPNGAAPGGETFEAFRSRVLRAFQTVIRDGAGTNTALVTHMGVIRVIMNSLFPDHSSWNPNKGIEYCAVYRLNIVESALRNEAHCSIDRHCSA
ncbi:MAG TPA: histidine phosphatase family protein [Bryobacteraceae bacterium]|jgi:alpha-ribazole phosphatase/probable phosphoglycerate mutase|nr:histidine phosphatase family protein [Bryobacteraceae bacterium]